MTAWLKSVQWISIEVVAAEFVARNKRLPLGTVLRELQRGWYKWTRDQQGVPGFKCGTPLTVLPPEHELPPITAEVTRDFIVRFAQEQNWAVPLSLAINTATDRRPGRPAKRMPEIMSEFERRVKAGELKNTLKQDAADLRAWAKQAFPADDIATVDTIANNISQLRRAGKRKKSAT